MLIEKMEPYLHELRTELRTISIEAARLQIEPSLLDPDGSDSSDAENHTKIAAHQNPAYALDSSKRIGARLGSLLKLVKDELLPSMRSDPEALFLAGAHAAREL